MSTDAVADIDWTKRTDELTPPRGLFVGGEEREAVTRARRPVHSPRDGAHLVDLAWADAADADAAVAEARKAFDHGPWPRMGARERGEVLLRFAFLVEQHRDEIALLVSLEMGKPIRNAWEIELRALIRCLQFYGGLADKVMGEIAPTVEGQLALVTREPAGVVAAVVPWNFPLTIGSWKFAPALAAGCTVVLKTAEQSPLSMQRVAALGVEAGLPPGVLNVLSGDGAVVGRRLGEHPDVDILTFTGSTAVGRHFLRYAADSNLKRVHLELGGKSPNIVFPDADLDTAARTAAWAIFFNSGEMCTAGSRLLVHEDVAEEFVARTVAAAESWSPDDPLLPGTAMGPMVDERSLRRVLGQLEQGVAQGARVAVGGTRAREDSGGPYLQPTIVTGASRDNVLVREELFAPVLAVQTFADEADAVSAGNDTEYGLAAAVWTTDLGRAHRVARSLCAGTVWVNCYEEGDMTVPFGGASCPGTGGTSRDTPSTSTPISRRRGSIMAESTRSGHPTGARPVVVVPARFSQSASALRFRAEVTAAKLVQAVYDAGGEPLVLHPDVPHGASEDELDQLVRERVWMADGILLPGGGDLAAHWAGQESHSSQYDVDEVQDAFDLALARVAVEDGIPLLAICRGTQVVNVARGGDLVQDLAETLGADHRHLVHDIAVTDDSPLRAIVPADRMTISCYHHQGLGMLGENLVASAHAEDGTIEAVALDGHAGWYLGVQWHPEDTAATDAQQAGVFTAFLEAVRQRRAAAHALA